MADAPKPNIVFVLCDNVGWGDFGVYGGGTPTPRIDQLAGEGIRFNNYTVEAQCTPTRSAIMTGRQSVRSGTFRVPFAGEGKAGLAPWEYTIAELLSDAGYATSLFGKWHCGDTEGRLPTDQGFDEWWGYRNSVDEAGWTSYATFEAIAKAKGIQPPQLWEGTKGGTQTAVRELNLEVRPLLDELIVEKAIDFITRQAAADTPFFTYVGLSHMHPPEAVHPDFDQTSPERLGQYADLIAEMDHRVGQIVDCVEQAGITDNTLDRVLQRQRGRRHPSDPGRIERTVPRVVHDPAVGGLDAGPRDGPLAREGAGRRRHRGDALGPRLVHDLRSAGRRLGQGAHRPADRRHRRLEVPARGERRPAAGRAILFFGPDGSLMSVKWHNMKAVLRYSEGIDQPIVTPQWPMLFDLASDPNELYNIMATKMDMGWMLGVALKFVADYEKSIARVPEHQDGRGVRGLRTTVVVTRAMHRPAHGCEPSRCI